MSEIRLETRGSLIQRGELSVDTRAMMLFESNKKSVAVAYLLWLFLGLLGGHNFYLRRTWIAVAQLVLTITYVGLVVSLPWIIIDAFLIPGWVRNQNNSLAARLGA